MTVEFTEVQPGVCPYRHEPPVSNPLPMCLLGEEVPGLFTERDILIQNTDILPPWYIDYIKWNNLYPQTAVGFPCLTGDIMVRSLVSGEVDLAYIAASQLTPEQMPKLRENIARRHRKYHSNQMPVGYVEEGDIEIPDTSITRTWTLVANYTTRAVANFVLYGRKIESEAMREYLQEKNPLIQVSPEALVELSRISQSPEFSERIGLVADLYATVMETLTTSPAMEIAVLRLDAIEKRHTVSKEEYEAVDLARVVELAGIAKEAILARARELGIPEEAALQFFWDALGFNE